HPNKVEAQEAIDFLENIDFREWENLDDIRARMIDYILVLMPNYGGTALSTPTTHEKIAVVVRKVANTVEIVVMNLKEEICSLFVYNISGKLVFFRESVADNTPVSIGKLSDGVYVATVVEKKQTTSTKLIIR
ncbi:MAG: T9SS type A sorting domain-containing protein, partial [Tannerella sp.]|nr:T9SS type A sorting domain-containing protein [Tannerella sp.]